MTARVSEGTIEGRFFHFRRTYPHAQRTREAAKNTFGVIAEEHLEQMKADGAAETTLRKVRWMLTDLAASERPIYHRNHLCRGVTDASCRGEKRQARNDPKASRQDWEDLPHRNSQPSRAAFLCITTSTLCDLMVF
jgi:hypothetical protein